MESLERFEGLSAAEMATLTNKRKFAILTLIGIDIIFIVFAAGALSSNSRFYIIAYFLFGVPFVSLLSWRELRVIRSLNRDIRGGKKKITVKRVESQRQDIKPTGSDSGPSMSYSYLIKVGGKELKVSELQYYQCKPGQLVEIHLAPNSEQVFSLSVLNDSAPEVNPQTASA